MKSPQHRYNESFNNSSYTLTKIWGWVIWHSHMSNKNCIEIYFKFTSLISADHAKWPTLIWTNPSPVSHLISIQPCIILNVLNLYIETSHFLIVFNFIVLCKKKWSYVNVVVIYVNLQDFCPMQFMHLSKWGILN